MPNRLVAVVLVVAVSTVLSGCLCGPDARSSACSGTTPSPPVHNHYYEDDDSDLILPIALGLVGVVLIGALIAKSGGGGDDAARPPARHTIITPEPAPTAYVISAPTATNADDIRLQRMYVQGHLSARAGRCEATLAIAHRMARLDPDYYRVYAADPTIAMCLRGLPASSL